MANPTHTCSRVEHTHQRNDWGGSAKPREVVARIFLTYSQTQTHKHIHIQANTHTRTQGTAQSHNYTMHARTIAVITEEKQPANGWLMFFRMGDPLSAFLRCKNRSEVYTGARYTNERGMHRSEVYTGARLTQERGIHRSEVNTGARYTQERGTHRRYKVSKTQR